jgi:hypothetical protein
MRDKTVLKLRMNSCEIQNEVMVVTHWQHFRNQELQRNIASWLWIFRLDSKLGILRVIPFDVYAVN